MKSTFWITFVLVLSFNTFASTQNIKPCTSRGLTYFEESIKNWTAEGYTNLSYIKNLYGDLPGYYAWDSRKGMHAEICDYSFAVGGYTAASEWYYWNSDYSKLDPWTWETGETYSIAQDEGLADFRAIDVQANGNVIAEFSVEGWNDSDPEQVLAKEFVIIEKFNEIL